VHEENSFEALEEFISSEILDFEAYLEAMELQQEYLGVKKRVR